MKVVHFSSTYLDGWGYQENLLPKYFKEMGHDVCVISLKKIPNQSKEENIFRNKYYIDDIEIRRIDVLLFLSFTFFITKGLYRNLKDLKPDIIFHHDICLTSLLVSVVYKIMHPQCALFVDNHADNLNCTKIRIWFFLYYKIILRIVTIISSSFIKKYYGVSHGRCDFLESVYKINKKKIKLLPIGADTLAAKEIHASDQEIRAEYSVPIDDFVVISGGKCGKDKGTDLLIQAIEELRVEGERISLVLFGSINDAQTQELADKSESVINIGWCERKTTLELLKMADVAVWPKHHTTLIEDSIACLTPIIIRKTETTDHLINGNGIFIEKCTVDEIKNATVQIINLDAFSLNKHCKDMRDKIDYKSIVKMIINNTLSV